ncbi:MAG: hypothetical protein IT307_01040 [Chloroflexi bacterium]|jgi:alkylhydroperoxidase family enzyme|nr:hypothetical protein [Chloroflexota bacterium]
MARLPYLNDDELNDRQRLVFDGCVELLGRVPNSMRLYARTPKVAGWFVPFLASLQREGAGGLLDGRTKELAILKTSLTNSCRY